MRLHKSLCIVHGYNTCTVVHRLYSICWGWILVAAARICKCPFPTTKKYFSVKSFFVMMLIGSVFTQESYIFFLWKIFVMVLIGSVSPLKNSDIFQRKKNQGARWTSLFVTKLHTKEILPFWVSQSKMPGLICNPEYSLYGHLNTHRLASALGCSKSVL